MTDRQGITAHATSRVSGIGDLFFFDQDWGPFGQAWRANIFFKTARYQLEGLVKRRTCRDGELETHLVFRWRLKENEAPCGLWYTGRIGWMAWRSLATYCTKPHV